TLMVPETLPMISACWPLISPSTTPFAPMMTLAEQIILPTRVPSIRRSPLLVISPLRVVPLLIRLALPEAVTGSVVSDLDLLLNMVLDLIVNFFRLRNFKYRCIRFYRTITLQHVSQTLKILITVPHLLL